MKFARITLLEALAIAPVFGSAAPVDLLPWSPPGPGDIRGPCPMLNTLANHNILPHSGTNITLNATIQGLGEGVNFSPSLATFLYRFAMLTVPTAGATTYSLHNLGTHGILEHDASISRLDKFLNNTDEFNQAVFDETTSYWHSAHFTLEQNAKSRLARAKTSVLTNPSYTYSPLAFAFAHGEIAALPLVFGDRVAGTAQKDHVISFFENERLPQALGWKRPAEPISNLDLCQMTQRIVQASGTTMQQSLQLVPCSEFDA